MIFAAKNRNSDHDLVGGLLRRAWTPHLKPPLDAGGFSTIALLGRGRGGVCTKAAAVSAALSVMYENHLEEKDGRTPRRIDDIAGDTVGDIACMEAVFFGSFAMTTCAALVLSAFPDALEYSWKAWRHPVLNFFLQLRLEYCLSFSVSVLCSRVRDEYGAKESSPSALCS